jgi:hypothetical protein
VYEEEASPGLAILFAILGVTFSIPHLNVIAPYQFGNDLLFWLLMSGASLAVPIAFALLTFKALSSKRIEIGDSVVTVTISRPVLPPIQWSESIADYRALVVKRPPESSNEPISVVLLHRKHRRRNVPLARTESEWEAHQIAEQYSTILDFHDSTEEQKPLQTIPDFPLSNNGSWDQTPPSQFEHIFVESYAMDGEYRLRQTDRQSTRSGIYAGLLATACALANGAYGGPMLLSIASGLIAALAAASIFRGAFTYDYIRITESGIARGRCICGSDHEQTFIPANEVEDVVIFEDDLDKYPAVHIVGKDAVICFGKKSTDQERRWLKQYVEENFHPTTVDQSDLV